MVSGCVRGHGTGGRPPAHEVEERRNNLIAVATAQFLSNGYEATSLERIARAAGASKTTIYRNFGDKAELFRTVFNRFVEPIWPELSDVSVEGKSPMEVLSAFGQLIISPSFIDRDAIALLRLVYIEAPRFPELAQIFTEAERSIVAVVSRYLEQARRQDWLRLTDPSWAASQFLELVWGTVTRRLMIGSTAFPDAVERRRVVDAAVSLFLNGTLHESRRPPPVDGAIA